MSKIVLVTETGSDLTPQVAERHGIQLVPMHVTFGDETREDGSFPAQEICDYYARTGTLPKTSGSSPEDFAKVFDAIHAAQPDAHILHLAYSAVTTVSYQSALLAAEDRDYVTSLDTRHVSIGLWAIVTSMARLLEEKDLSPQEAKAAAEDLSRRARMCFIPDDLEYLRAGGRISNAVYFLAGRLLRLHPQVELLEGKLVATKKYRGAMDKVVAQMVEEYAAHNDLDRQQLWLLHTVGLSDQVRQSAEEAARACGFAQVSWSQAQGVITTHGGPGAFAMAGFARA